MTRHRSGARRGQRRRKRSSHSSTAPSAQVGVWYAKIPHGETTRLRMKVPKCLRELLDRRGGQVQQGIPWARERWDRAFPGAVRV